MADETGSPIEQPKIVAQAVVTVLENGAMNVQWSTQTPEMAARLFEYGKSVIAIQQQNAIEQQIIAASQRVKPANGPKTHGLGGFMFRGRNN